MATASGSFSSRPTNTLRLTVNQGTQSVSGNYTNVSWYLDLIENYGSFVNNPTGSYSININGTTYTGTFPAFARKTTTRIRSGSTQVAHNADGTKSFNFSASATGVNVLGSASLSGSMSLKTIPRASTATFNGGSSLTAGTAVTITTNRHSTSFTHTITYKFGSATGSISTSAGASVSWTPALTLLSQIPNGTSGSGSITVVTKSGSTNIGTKTTSFTLNAAAGVKPTISSLTLTEMNSAIATAGLTGAYVQGISQVRAVVNAAGIYGSTIKTRTFTIDNVEAASGDTVAITGSGSTSISAEVIDSRDRKGTHSTSITVLPYTPPTPNSVIVRRSTSSRVVSDTGTYLRVDLNAAVQSLISGTQKNTLKIEVFTRARGATSWGTAKNTINHTAITYNTNFLVGGGGAYPLDDSFEVLVRLSDKFNQVNSQLVVATSTIFMHWSKTGVGIGKYHENGKLDVAGDIYSSGNLRATGDVYQGNRRALDSRDYATSAQTQAGSSSAKAVTPSGLASMPFAGDSGDVSLTSYLTGGFTGSVSVRAVGRVVELTGVIAGSIPASGTTVDIMSAIPAQYRPSPEGNTRFGAAWRSGYAGNVVVRTTGTVGMAQNTVSWSGASFTITYLRA